MSELIQKTAFEIANWNESKAITKIGGEIRNHANHLLNELDFPTTRQEAWKYLRLASLKKEKFQLNPTFASLDLSGFVIPELVGSVLVFVNGFFQSDLSTLKTEIGIEVAPLSASESDWSREKLGTILPLEGQFFNAMNTAYATDGVAIRITKNAQIEETVQVVFINTGEQTFAATRNVIIAEAFSKAHLVIGYYTSNATKSFTNAVTEIEVHQNATLTIDKIQLENENSFAICTEEVKQHQDTTFTINTITLDGGLVRNNLHIAVDGQNSESNLSGAYILRGKQIVDNHTIVDHKVAHCVSNELYKGVMDEQSTAIFNGKVFVRKDAQKINAFQSNGNVLLSDTATINSKPELEIYADDVKCSHGSTTGQLDEEAVFYLRARGLSEKSARALMVSAFIGDVLEKVESEPVRQFIDKQLLEKFGWEF